MDVKVGVQVQGDREPNAEVSCGSRHHHFHLNTYFEGDKMTTVKAVIKQFGGKFYEFCVWRIRITNYFLNRLLLLFIMIFHRSIIVFIFSLQRLDLQITLLEVYLRDLDGRKR